MLRRYNLYSEDGVRSVVEEAVTAHPQLVEARLVEAMRELAMEMGVDCDEVLSKYGDDRMKRKTDEDAKDDDDEEEEEEEERRRRRRIVVVAVVVAVVMVVIAVVRTNRPNLEESIV